MLSNFAFEQQSLPKKNHVNHDLEQRSASFSCKGPDCKYYNHCGAKAVTDNMQTNGHACVPIQLKFYLLEFPIKLQ